MTHVTIRAINRLRDRSRRRGDQGLETAEVLMWMAVVVGIIGVLSGVLQDILNGVVDQIQSALGDIG